MNNRTVDIINDIVNQKSGITLTNLAKKYKVTERTIRNDINAINDVLKQNDLSALNIKKGGEISQGTDFETILSIVSRADFYDYKLSKEERAMIAATMLITTVEYITLSMIADNLYVSRATIINDLDEIKKMIEEGGIKSSFSSEQRSTGRREGK